MVTVISEFGLCRLSDCQTAMCVEVRGLDWVYPAGSGKYARQLARQLQIKYPDSEIRIVSTAHLIKERRGDDFVGHIVPAGTFERQNPKPKWCGPHRSSDFTTFTHDEPHQNSKRWEPGEREAAAARKAEKIVGKGKRKRRDAELTKVADNLCAELFG